ncbi:hypothetical protein PanWU01x14_189850, partial [Parasponia andersonii]
LEYLQGVNPGGQNRSGAGPLELLEELASGHVRVLGGQCPNPSGGELAAGGVDGVPILFGDDAGVNTEVLAGGEAEGEDPGLGAEVAELVVVEELELGKGLLHLVNGSGTVDELERGFGVGEGVAGDEGEEGDGLARPSRHLQEAVALGVQGSLQFKHVSVLFRVDVVVREVHRHVLNLELHGRFFPSLPVVRFFFSQGFAS